MATASLTIKEIRGKELETQLEMLQAVTKTVVGNALCSTLHILLLPYLLISLQPWNLGIEFSPWLSVTYPSLYF